jgi:hypothetical protein
VITLIVNSSDKYELEKPHAIIEYIVNYCQEHLSGNALVKSKEQCETAATETNHLQVAQDELMDGREQEEELINHSYMPSTSSSIPIFDTHEQGPLWHTKNDKFVYDASLSSNNPYCVKTGDNISVKALCLDIQLETINNDELEIDSCSTNVQGQEENIANDMFIDDASFCEWLDISRTDELASKYDELEE